MKKILAVDDEISCLEIIDFSLTSRGYEVITVSGGDAAIEYLEQNASIIDVILLDMMMPGMNGVEALVKIRQIEAAKLIPVIFQTGASDCETTSNNRLDFGPEYIIRKPYKRDELIAAIKHALQEME